MLVEPTPTTRFARFKRWLIEHTFDTLNAEGYGRWKPDQWYIARTKHVLDYVTYCQIRNSSDFWVMVAWLLAWLVDMLNAFSATTSSLALAYFWLVIGQAYLAALLLKGCIGGMNEKYNTTVHDRVLRLLPFDQKNSYNGREHSHEGLTGEGFDLILHSEVKNCTLGRFSLFYYDADRDLFLDFADIADSLTIPAITDDVDASLS